MKPYGTRDDKDLAMKNLKIAPLRTEDYARARNPRKIGPGSPFCTRSRSAALPAARRNH